jgi:WD40 repeat protein
VNLLELVITLATIVRTCATPITALAFSPDSATLVSSGYRSIALRDPKTGSVNGSVAVDFPRVTALAFSSNGQILAVGGGTPGVNGRATLLRWPDKSVLKEYTSFSDLVSGVAISSDGKYVGIASSDHSARVLSFDRTNELRLIGHSGPVLSIAFAPAGDHVLTASADRSLKVWSLPQGALLRSFSHHTETVHVVAFRPGSNSPSECASGSDDQTVRIWQPAIGRMVRIIRRHDGPVFALAYTPDGKALFSAGEEGIIRQLEIESDNITEQIQAHEDAIYSLAINSDGSTIASGDWTGNVRVRPLRPIQEK